MQSTVNNIITKYPVLRYTNKNVVLRAINVGNDTMALAALDKRPKEQYHRSKEDESKKKKLRNDINYHSVLLKRDMMGLSQQEQAILLMISTKGPGPIPKQSRTLTKPAAFTLATASRSTFKKSHRQPLQPLVPIKRSTSKAYFEDGSKGFESFERPVQSYEHPMKKMAALVEGWKKEEGVVEKEEEIKVSQDAEEMKLSDLDTGAWRREAEEKRVAEKTNAQLDATLQEIEDRIAVIKRDDEERWAAILEFRRQERLRMVPTITLTPPDDDDTWDEELYHYSKDPQDRKLLHPYWKQPQDIIILQTKMIIVKIEEEEEEYDLSQDDLSLYEFPFQHRRNYERSTSPPDYIPERNSSSAGFY